MILNALSELDIHSGKDREATTPYVELNEYFEYLTDQRSSEPEYEQYNSKQLARFRKLVSDFVASTRQKAGKS